MTYELRTPEQMDAAADLAEAEVTAGKFPSAQVCVIHKS